MDFFELVRNKASEQSQNWLFCTNLDLFADNFGQLSDEQGERFHQEMVRPKNDTKENVTLTC